MQATDPIVDLPLRPYMTSPLFSAMPEDSLRTIHARLARHRIASLPVVDDDRLVGVITRSDLVRVSRRHGGSAQPCLLTLPDQPVRTAMSTTPVKIDLDARLSEAATAMVAHHVHCVYVVDGDVAVGLVSPRGLVKAIRDAGCQAPIAAIMSAPVLAIRAQQPVSRAVEQLASERVRGLVVVDDEDRPLGMFTQVEALAAWDRPAVTPVGELMEPIACVSTRTTLHAAADRFLALGVRGILAVDRGEVRGFATGADFARFMSAFPR